MTNKEQLIMAEAWLVNARDFKRKSGPCHCGSCACRPCTISRRVLRAAGEIDLAIGRERTLCKPHEGPVDQGAKRIHKRKPRKSKSPKA